MKRLSLFFLLSASLLFLPYPLLAADKNPIQIQLLGSNIGSGANLGYHFNDVFFLGLDFTSISLTSSETDSSGTVDAKLDFSTQIFLLRASPFSGSFFLQAGLASRSWKVEAKGTSLIGDTNQAGIVTATVEFPSPGYALGLGWNWIADFGLSGGLSLGTIMGGDPEVEMTAVSLGLPVAQSEVDKEKEKLKEDMAQFASFPYVSFSLGWNF